MVKVKRKRFVPTLEFLNQTFSYDKKAGLLKWKQQNKYRSKKDWVGCIHKGYASVYLNKSYYLIHRLIWFIEKNEWPKMVDHINGDTLDNRIGNLRACGSRINQQNRKYHRSGKKLVGAYFSKRSGRWSAQSLIDGKVVRFGSYKTQEEANSRYKQELKNRGIECL